MSKPQHLTNDVDVWADPPAVTVNVAEPKIVGTILGPDGQPLHTVLAPRQPFGFGRTP